MVERLGGGAGSPEARGEHLGGGRDVDGPWQLSDADRQAYAEARAALDAELYAPEVLAAMSEEDLAGSAVGAMMGVIRTHDSLSVEPDLLLRGMMDPLALLEFASPQEVARFAAFAGEIAWRVAAQNGGGNG